MADAVSAQMADNVNVGGACECERGAGCAFDVVRDVGERAVASVTAFDHPAPCYDLRQELKAVLVAKGAYPCLDAAARRHALWASCAISSALKRKAST